MFNKTIDPLVREILRTKALPKKTLRLMLDCAQTNHFGLTVELLAWDVMSEMQILSLMKDAYSRYPFTEAQSLLNGEVVLLTPLDLATRFHFFPLSAVGEVLFIAMPAPPSHEVIEELQKELDIGIEIIVADHKEIGAAIEIWRDFFKKEDAPKGERPVDVRLHDLAMELFRSSMKHRDAVCVLMKSFGSQYTSAMHGKVDQRSPERIYLGAEGRALIHWFRRCTDIPLEHDSQPTGTCRVMSENSEGILEVRLSRDLFRRDKISIRFLEECEITSAHESEI